MKIVYYEGNIVECARDKELHGKFNDGAIQSREIRKSNIQFSINPLKPLNILDNHKEKAVEGRNLP